MSSRQANSLKVEFVNGTSSYTLKFFHRAGFLSSQKRKLKTLPPRGNNVKQPSFVFYFENGTNEFIDVEYKVEVKNQIEVENEIGSVVRRRTGETYKPVGIPIDSTVLLHHSRISVVDSEAAQSSAEASSRKKFELRTEPRAVQNEAGWLVTLVMKLFSGVTYVFSGVKYVSSGFRNLIPAAQPPPNLQPPVESADASGVQRVPAAVSSAINYVSNSKVWSHLPTANPRQSMMPR